MCALLRIFLLISAMILVTNGIMGGEYSLANLHQVSLRRLKYESWTPVPTTENFCGGAILNRRWILTAAHCCTKKRIPKIDDLFIGMGALKFERSSKMHRAEEIIRHPKYDQSKQHLKYDIALIRTSTDIEFSDRIQPMKLARDWVVGNQKTATVAGWGLKDHLEDSLYMRWTYLTTQENNDCIQMYGEPASTFVDDSILCAFYRYGNGLCHGDGGNPLVLNNKIVGIALWDVSDVKSPCAIGKPDRFTRVSYYLDWIENHVNVSIV